MEAKPFFGELLFQLHCWQILPSSVVISSHCTTFSSFACWTTAALSPTTWGIESCGVYFKSHPKGPWFCYLLFFPHVLYGMVTTKCPVVCGLPTGATVRVLIFINQQSDIIHSLKQKTLFQLVNFFFISHCYHLPVSKFLLNFLTICFCLITLKRENRKIFLENYLQGSILYYTRRKNS